MNGNAIKNVAGLLLCDVVCIRHHRAKPEWHTRLHLFRHISKKFLSVVHYSLRIFVSSDEKSDGAIAPPELRGEALIVFCLPYRLRIRIFSLSGLLSADIQRYFKRGAFTEVV